MIRQILAACTFYTRLPIPKAWIRAEDFGGIARWLPLIGLGIGGWLVAGHSLLQGVLSDRLEAGGLLLLWISSTGGLHLDGVADTADGLAVDAHDQAGQARRLAVMTDSRTGAFGVIPVGMVLLL